MKRRSETLFDFSLVKMYYHISPEGAEHPIYDIPATGFFDPATLQEALKRSGETVQAISNALPASFIGTSLCKVSIVQLLFASMYNRLLDMYPDNMNYQVEMHDDHAHLGYKIKELRSIPVPTEPEERKAFLLQHWAEYFTNFVTPAIEAIAEAGDLKPDAIWQQFSGQLKMTQDFVAAHMQMPQLTEQFLADSKLLAEFLDPALFNRRRNPYYLANPRYVENPYNTEEKWLIPSSCCMYDRRENGTKCYTCPRMTHDEREARKCEILEEAAVH
ncbi:(2Fe-2S)-binding protein [Paenibacillus glycanilyticus]|uniref:(2Fe-2S)-binding protein n=1 Tax=Paenibacillus glycanilyticus TaxID=126569 RepID=UPI001910A867|nr:(2Fe-2S)-binding protein [Paenibacillus glycanilyticus]